MADLYLRSLVIDDAKVSWHWRNDPEVWKFTGNKPDKPITYKIELDWIQKVLNRGDEIRFAICEKQTGNYIGNVQLTNINGYDAQLHIFIGNKNFWGKGFGTEATRKMAEYGFNELKLKSVYLDVKKGNLPGIRAYQKAGFSDIFEYDEYHRMAIFITDQIQKKVSVFVMAYNHERFISEALEGMLMQQVNFEFDIVVGDDFSTDSTRSILLEYAIKYPKKFKLLFYPYNVSAAINQIWVLKNCLGKYIAMCEGDDYWTDTNKLQKQVDFLEANDDYAICFHSFKIENLTLQTNYNSDKNLKTESTLFDLANNSFIPTLSVLFRNCDRTNFYTWIGKCLMGDYPLFLYLAQYGKIHFMNADMAVYRIHDKGAWNGIDINLGHLNTIKTLNILIENIPQIKNELLQQQYERLKVIKLNNQNLLNYIPTSLVTLIDKFEQLKIENTELNRKFNLLKNSKMVRSINAVKYFFSKST